MNQGIPITPMPVGPPVGTYRNPGGTQQAALPGDPFAMLLTQLLGNQQQASETLPQLPDQADRQQETLDAAMELMAQTLAVNLLPLTAPIPGETLEAALTGSSPHAQGIIPQLAPEPLLPKEPQQSALPDTAAEAPRDSDPKAPFAQLLEQPEVLAQPKTVQAPPDLEAFRFQTVVRQVADELSTHPKAKEAPDVEALQAAVEQKQFVLPQHRSLEAAAAEAPPEAKEVIPQLSTGILDNLSAGKDEFVVKLKPEGLGEITVKLVEKEGKILLSILTSSPQVAKALSQDVAALQQSLRPLQAQVQEIAVAESTAAGQQLNHQSQNHRPGQQQWTDRNPRRSRGGFTPSPTPDPLAVVAAPGMSRGLSVYI